MKKELKRKLVRCYLKRLMLHLTNEQVFGYVKNEDKLFDVKLEIKEIKRKLKYKFDGHLRGDTDVRKNEIRIF